MVLHQRVEQSRSLRCDVRVEVVAPEGHLGPCDGGLEGCAIQQAAPAAEASQLDGVEG
jgi:hypothetical protein